MAIQTINIGNVVNDGLGDDLRTAFQKVNDNFVSVSNQFSITVADATASGVSLFKQRTETTLEFKTLSPGTKISLTDTLDSIIINNTANDAFERIDTEANGVIIAGIGNSRRISMEGIANPTSTTRRQDIEVTALGSIVQFKTTLPVTDILTTYDFGYIDTSLNNAIQLSLASANVDFGILRFDNQGGDLISSTLNIDCGGII